MPQFQLAVPQLYNERSHALPAGEKPSTFPATTPKPPPISGLLGQRGAPPARPGMGGGGAPLCRARGGVPSPAPGSAPPQVRAAAEQEGGSTPGWHFCQLPIRQPSRKHSAMMGGRGTRWGETDGRTDRPRGSFGSRAGLHPPPGAERRANPAAGAAGERQAAGRANKTRRGSPEPGGKGPPSPAATSRRPPPARPRGLPPAGAARGSVPRGHGGGFSGGPRKRKFALALLLPPASDTEEPAIPSLPSRPVAPRGTATTDNHPPHTRPPPPRPVPTSPAPPPGPLPAGRPAGRHPPRRAPRTRQVSGGRKGVGVRAGREGGREGRG